MKKILVVGSSNIDMVMKVPHLPKPGETVGHGEFELHHGGKGANQAVAAARSGGDVTFISTLGDDLYGDRMLTAFEHEGINTAGIEKAQGITTGSALIFVDSNGENSIGVAPGANDRLTPNRISELSALIESSDIVLMQLEIPLETVKAVLQKANALGKTTILNTAPAIKISQDLLQLVDLLILNETEAEIVSGVAISEVKDTAENLMNMGANSVLITLGSQGSFYASSNENFTIPAFSVEAIDTVAAGDVFCGSLTTALSKGHTMKEALEFASAAAAISVTRAGAQTSAPNKTEIDDFLSKKAVTR